MTYEYERVVTPRDGLRLHLNENTSGCSPAVLDALRSLSSDDAAFYPDYTEAIAACARYVGVDAAHVLLTNGLDEGILAASVVALRGATAEEPYEAVVAVPAFDMYAACADAAGGRVVEVPQTPAFEFPLEAVLAAVTPRTRIVFITDPNNPTGRSVPAEAILRVAAAAPAALIFVDEAYVDFRGRTIIGAADAPANILVGRTFAKAQGLAALRAGALVGSPASLEPIRRVVPPYSLNVAAAVALPAALADQAHIDRYVAEVRQSKALLYDALTRLGIEYWESDANFVLVRFGPAARHVLDRVRSRGIYLRDRSKDPGCAGCVRITTGVVEHTRRAILAIEEALCAGR